MTKDEALKLALQELEGIPFYRTYGVRISNAITAIKEALDVPETNFGNMSQPEQDRNFCPRCGKRTADLTVIHTCTPPRGLEMT